MWSLRKKLEVPAPEQCLPGRAIKMAVRSGNFVNGHALAGPYPRGLNRRYSASAASGRRAQVLGGARGLTTAVGYAGGSTLNPTYEEVCSARRAIRGRACRVRPEGDELRRAVEGILGKPRPDPGACARWQRCRDAIPRRFTPMPRTAPRREASRERYQARLAAAGLGTITTEIRAAPQFYFAEDYHQQYLAKNPYGYCGLGGTGVSCPVGTEVGA